MRKDPATKDKTIHSVDRRLLRETEVFIAVNTGGLRLPLLLLLKPKTLFGVSAYRCPF